MIKDFLVGLFVLMLPMVVAVSCTKIGGSAGLISALFGSLLVFVLYWLVVFKIMEAKRRCKAK